MSDEHIEARNGFVEICIGGGYEREPENYTIAEAREFAARITAEADKCDAQRQAIESACADGHLWDEGTNGYMPWPDRKITSYWCEREGCDGRKVEEGWR